MLVEDAMERLEQNIIIEAFLNPALESKFTPFQDISECIDSAVMTANENGKNHKISNELFCWNVLKTEFHSSYIESSIPWGGQ